MDKLINFLNQLEEFKIFYKLDKIRDDSVLVEIAVPGERWEVEFMANGAIEIEKFLSVKDMYGEKELEALFKNFSDK